MARHGHGTSSKTAPVPKPAKSGVKAVVFPEQRAYYGYNENLAGRTDAVVIDAEDLPLYLEQWQKEDEQAKSGVAVDGHSDDSVAERTGHPSGS